MDKPNSKNISLKNTPDPKSTKNQLNDMIKIGIIVKSSLNNHNSPVILVPKDKKAH